MSFSQSPFNLKLSNNPHVIVSAYQGLYNRDQESLPYVHNSCMSVSYLLTETEKAYIQNLLLMSILHNPIIESFIFSISEHAKLSSLH